MRGAAVRGAGAAGALCPGGGQVMMVMMMVMHSDRIATQNRTILVEGT